MTCETCKDQGLTGWEKPMGDPPQMVFIPQFCQCERGQSLAAMNAPDAKRTVISSMHTELSQSRLASAIMGVPGWSVSEPDATHSQIAHRIAREIISVLSLQPQT